MSDSLLISNVYMSMSEILHLFLERFEQKGLVCNPAQEEVGKASTTGAVLVNSGDVGIGGGTSDIKKKVWNPFTVRQREGDWWEARISISEVNRYLKNFGDTTLEGRDIRVHREAYVRDEYSAVGCLLGLIPGLLFFFEGLAAGRLIVGAVFAILITLFVHWVVRGVVKLVVSANTRERDNLLRRVDEVLSALAAELPHQGGKT